MNEREMTFYSLQLQHWMLKCLCYDHTDYYLSTLFIACQQQHAYFIFPVSFRSCFGWLFKLVLMIFCHHNILLFDVEKFVCHSITLLCSALRLLFVESFNFSDGISIIHSIILLFGCFFSLNILFLFVSFPFYCIVWVEEKENSSFKSSLMHHGLISM